MSKSNVVLKMIGVILGPFEGDYSGAVGKYYSIKTVLGLGGYGYAGQETVAVPV